MKVLSKMYALQSLRCLLIAVKIKPQRPKTAKRDKAQEEWS
jgi:hypothetical protein